MNYLRWSGVILVLYELMEYTIGDQIVNSFNGIIGAGNYSYYKLPHQGYIRLILESVKGDSDLYISSTTSRPTFNDYELQSVTCGEDVVDLPPAIKRPVVIGVYGYDAHISNIYTLRVMTITDYDHGYPEELAKSDYFNNENSRTTRKLNQKSLGVPGKDEEESILWTIFVGIMKIVFDVLV